MRQIEPWNKGWEYMEAFTPEFIKGKECPDIEQIELPHSNSRIGCNYFDESIYQKLCGYRKSFFAPVEWEGKNVRLVLQGAAHYATVYLNGHKIAEHMGGYTGFQAELSEELLYGQNNVLGIRLDSREQLNTPPFGKVIDYMTFGGLYREAYLEITGQSRIEDIFIQTPDVCKDTKQLSVQVTMQLSDDRSDNLVLKYSVLDEDQMIAGYSQQVIADKAQASAQTLSQTCFSVPGASLWHVDTPFLYTLRTGLYRGDDLVDEVDTTFGFRSARFERDGFYLNGEKIKIIGLNRHQSYPIVGYAMPERGQALDARLLKEELGVNAVRTSHYPQSHSFINECDRLGLLVFMEIPGWQHIGDEQWQDMACRHTREMVMQYRNHPSIIVWGVRINESQDNDDFYKRTNKIAHELDPSRQTSGVRFIQKSSLLEDVYGYNDFSHNGTNSGVEPKKKVSPDRKKPYLITEYNGHMFPTKSFDWEGKRLEHALRHARVIDGYYGQEDICGGFGWCMFDYHTHQDFGSGDRICYHGVMDMYRNPKLAAAVYKSQLAAETVLKISSSMDIGEHPVGTLGTVYAFTNADSVKAYKNDEFIREFYPDRKNFPHMPHPPIPIDDFVGGLLEEKEGFDPKTAQAIKEIMKAVAATGLNNLSLLLKLKMLYYMRTKKLTFDDCYRIFSEYMGNWGDAAISYRFEAVKDGQVVKTVCKEPVRKIVLEARADTTRLQCSGGYDVAAIRIRALDQNGNTLPYYQEPLQLTVSGPIGLLGDDVISLKGGMGGTYVRTVGERGAARLYISGNGVETAELLFTVEE